MKRFIFVLISVMYLGTVYSCDDEIEPIGLNDIRESKSDSLALLAEMRAKGPFYYLEENSNASLRNRVRIDAIKNNIVRGDNVLLTAVREGRHWFGVSEDGGVSFIFEWHDTEFLTDTLHTVYVGYGETKKFHSEFLVPRLYKIYNNDEVLVAFLLNEDKINTSDYYLYWTNNMVLFDETLIEVIGFSDYYIVSFVDKSTGSKKKLLIEGNVINGYNESIFTDNACISKGDTLFTYTTPNNYNLKPSEVEFISYNEGVNVVDDNSVSIYYVDYKNNIAKEFNINTPFKIPSDAQPKYTATYKGYENRILHYIVDVIYFDGTKKQFSVSINVDTDEITTA